MPTGQEAPWRGRRITRTSSAKYLPPNCAPMPGLARQLERPRLELQVAERPARSSPEVGRPVVVAGRRRA